MNIEIRIYKRYDTDLLAMHDAGYSMTKMMEEAVTAYANSRPCHFFIDEILPFDLNDKKSVRLRLKISDADVNTVTLIKNIKHSYRSNFCKQVLRNALVQQNILCYLADPSFYYLYDNNVKHLNLAAYPNLINCSQFRRRNRNIRIMGKDIEVKSKKGYTYNPNGNTFAQPYSPAPAQQPVYPQMPQQQPVMTVYPQTYSVPQYQTGFQGSAPLPAAPAQPAPQAQYALTNTYPAAAKAPAVMPNGALTSVAATTVPPEPISEPEVLNDATTQAPGLAGNQSLMAMFDGL